ncbi:50S ribosome-binding protein YggL [Acidovorax sp. sic0104]|uniref:50S ribosome-binding protein YggL n=1 Tax=Acidovorax sp. sic0104 TaxID=2854784 RepID=UPI001C487F56|nr:50S ribosome-binding protein YggL [Acidovorax sp. sic0104]MBV7542203.1 YggL family protein [Acidovorax sp. sic0104]
MKYRPPANRNRSRRLRKKLRIGEFAETGFNITIEHHKVLSSDEQRAFLLAFLEQLVEPLGLAFGGGANVGFVSRMERGSASQQHRQAFSAWLASRSDVKTFEVGGLVDAWHGHRQ